MGRPGVDARSVFTVNTVLFSLGAFDVSESESGKELRLGGGSLVRESFVCKHEDLGSDPGSPYYRWM